jgi:tetratricopeptide (TPR) repeat protein
VLLRTVKGLIDANVSVRRACRVLLKLQGQLPAAKSLAAVRIVAEGNTVVVREDTALWEAETGQVCLDFELQDVPQNIATLTDRNLIIAKEVEAYDSDEWYNLGLDLEDLDPERAPEAYARAIELDPENADAHVNLGRLMQLRGNLKLAKRHYERALNVAPNHQLALYNLGTVFDELNEMDSAADYYRRAPGVPDAHYNLSRISELRGDELSARRHMRDYRRLLDLAER